MKAVIQSDGSVRLVDDEVKTDPDATRLFVDSEPPAVESGQVAVPEFDVGGEVVRRTWSVRAKTEEEIQQGGYQIPIALLFKEIRDEELVSLIRRMRPAATDEQIQIEAFIIRALAQTNLHSTNPKLQEARSIFSFMGKDRIDELFRKR